MSRYILPKIVTNTDKLLMYVLEIARADQVAWLLETSQTKGRPLEVMVIEAVALMMNSLTWEERKEVIAQFKEEDGIDVEELL
jgi:hypothetical protein